MENLKPAIPIEEQNSTNLQPTNPNSIVNTWIKGMTPMGRRKEDFSETSGLNSSYMSHQSHNTSRSPMRQQTNPKNTLANKENTTPKNVVKIKGKKENIMVLVGKEKSPVAAKKNPATPKKNTPRGGNNPQVFRSPTARGGAGSSKAQAGRFFPTDAQQQSNAHQLKPVVEQAIEPRHPERPASDYFERAGEQMKRETFHSININK
jgi:hypothetical protein